MIVAIVVKKAKTILLNNALIKVGLSIANLTHSNDNDLGGKRATLSSPNPTATETNIGILKKVKIIIV